MEMAFDVAEKELGIPKVLVLFFVSLPVLRNEESGMRNEE
jgi:hypothetical protein